MANTKRAPVPHPDPDHPTMVFPDILYSVTQSLALAQRKLKEYASATQAPRWAVETEIALQTARYTNITHTENIVTRWLDAESLPPSFHGNARLCLAQITLLKSIIQQSLDHLKLSLATATDSPRIDPIFKPIEYLHHFTAFLEDDNRAQDTRYAKYEAMAALPRPEINDYDIALLDDDIADDRSTIEASRALLDHWTYTCMPSITDLVVIDSARHSIDHQAKVLDALEIVVATLRTKTIEAMLTIQDAASQTVTN